MFSGYELLYWSLLSAIFVIPSVIAIILMQTTRKLGPAFFCSLAASILITAISSVWWHNASVEPANYTWGRIIFFFIAFVSTQVLILFVLFALKKNPESPPD